MSRLETPEAMAARLYPSPSGLATKVAAYAIEARDAAILERLEEVAEWSFDERKMLDLLNALRAELRGGA